MEEIKIPEGTKSMTCNIEGNKVILEFIPKNEFKDGDVLAHGENIVIYNRTMDYGANVCYGGLNTRWNKIIFWDTPKVGFGDTKYCRLATDEEKQKLFDAMAKEGLKWNAENKKVEKIRWRAYFGCKYFYFNSKMSIESCQDIRDDVDTARHDIGNYFKTEEEAERKAEKIKKILKGE